LASAVAALVVAFPRHFDEAILAAEAARFKPTPPLLTLLLRPLPILLMLLLLLALPLLVVVDSLP
jgi:hypothetical protein